jgi:hypothetical protein
MDKPPQDASADFPPPTGLALASLVVGIAALGLSFILVGFLIGLVGVGLGLAYLAKKRGPKTMARWGVVLSCLGVVASLGFAALYYHYFQLMKGSFAAGTATPTGALAAPAPLPASASLLKSNLVWSVPIPTAMAVCVGDWESDGSARVLVADGSSLHVLDMSGVEKATLTLPQGLTAIECGRSKTAGARLLGYTVWGNNVSVIDHAGKVLWSKNAGSGVDGAHWGDLDGDGNDEMVLSMNGFGGLRALSGDGKKLWSASILNVWSAAIIPRATNGAALVLATDASGSVNVFDASGQRLNSLRPEGGYYTGVAAGMTESNTVQILAFCQTGAATAFDLTGKVAWITSSTSGTTGAAVTADLAAMGDFVGDGAKEWAFIDGTGDIVIATTSGQKIASVPLKGAGPGISQGFATAPRAGQGCLLVILDGGVVKAYSFGR